MKNLNLDLRILNVQRLNLFDCLVGFKMLLKRNLHLFKLESPRGLVSSVQTDWILQFQSDLTETQVYLHFLAPNYREKLLRTW